MDLLIAFANFIAIAASCIFAIRLLAFRRGQKRYRRFVSLAAWAFINLSVANVIWLACYGHSDPLFAVLNAACLSRLAYLACITKGNMAPLIIPCHFFRYR